MDSENHCQALERHLEVCVFFFFPFLNRVCYSRLCVWPQRPVGLSGDEVLGTAAAAAAAAATVSGTKKKKKKTKNTGDEPPCQSGCLLRR